VVTLLPASTAHAASSCHGLPATIEGSVGIVTGTSGPDVIVATGAVRRVRAGDGDDLVCLVDTSKRIYVDAGAGNDEVDASAAGARTETSLGAGANIFTGSAFADYVIAGTLAPSGTLGDGGPDQISTGPGADGLAVNLGAVVDAHLGTGDDGVYLEFASGVPVSRLDLGAGRDAAGFEDPWDRPGAGETSLRVDLTHDLVDWHGATFTLQGAEDIRGAARRVVLLGDRHPNKLVAHGCDVVVKGAAGDDSLTLSSVTADVAPDIGSCSTSRLRAYGNAGDDYLSGGRRHDVLIGGSGFDLAFGGIAGHDRCDAERMRGQGCKR
jgi:Ca2+-binding RTX toxin-like protein